MKTVGELKEFLKNLDDNMPLVAPANNLQLKNPIVSDIPVRVESFNIEKKQIEDGFDYSVYYKDVYSKNENGIKCLQIG